MALGVRGCSAAFKCPPNYKCPVFGPYICKKKK